jgi:hypothetical protein
MAPDVTPTDAVQQEEVNAMRLRRGVPPAQIMREQGEEVPEDQEEELDAPMVPTALRPLSGGVGDFL